MRKIDEYKKVLSNLKDWDQYLMKESGLPGPRANLELLEAFVESGSEDVFTRFIKEFDQEKAPVNAPGEFLAACGVAGLGKLIAEGQTTYFSTLRTYAADRKWRIREAVAIALQTVGVFDK